MSRTIRAKRSHVECLGSWATAGRKVAGTIYTIREWIGGTYVYRCPTTPRERYEQFRMWYAESKSSNSRSPDRWYRSNRMKQNRMITKGELAKWIKNPEYEPLVEANPRSCQWDWS